MTRHRYDFNEAAIKIPSRFPGDTNYFTTTKHYNFPIYRSNYMCHQIIIAVEFIWTCRIVCDVRVCKPIYHPDWITD